MRNKNVNKVLNLLIKETNPISVYLFGSYARGTNSKNSDMDFLIIKDTDQPKHKRALAIRRKLYDLMLPVDILVRTQQEFNKYKNVVGTIPYIVSKEGLKLYEKQ